MTHQGKGKPPRVGDNKIFRRALLTIVLLLVGLMIVAPLVVIGVEAFSKGIAYFGTSIAHPDTRHAIMLTVLALNLVGDGLNDALNPKLRDR